MCSAGSATAMLCIFTSSRPGARRFISETAVRRRRSRPSFSLAALVQLADLKSTNACDWPFILGIVPLVEKPAQTLSTTSSETGMNPSVESRDCSISPHLSHKPNDRVSACDRPHPSRSRIEAVCFRSRK